MALSNSYKGVIYASISLFCWGTLAVFLKVTVKYVQPINIVWVRFIVAFSILLVYFLLRKPSELNILIKPPWRLVLTSIFLCVNYFAFITGIGFTTPNNAQVFIQLGPMLLAIAGLFVFKEKLGVLQALGFIIAISGFYFFYSQQMEAFSDKGTSYNMGVFWVVVAAVSWAAYAVVQKQLVKKFPVQQLNLVIFGLPILFLLPFIQFKEFNGLAPWLWPLMIFLGINTFVAYTFIALALKHLEANKVSIIITNNPIITFISMALLGYFEVSWIEHERMTISSFIGAGLVIAGTIMAVFFRKK